MKRILGIGNALVDIIIHIDTDSILERFSLPKGSMQMVDNEKSKRIRDATVNFNTSLASGGSAANTINGIAMLGVKTGFIGSVGKDDTGDFFEKDMKSAGVKTYLSRRDTVTGTATVLISPDTERTFATHLGAAVELEADDLNPLDFKGYDILYLEGYLIFNKPLVDRACQLASENKMKIVLDMASYNVVCAKIDDFKEIIEKYIDIVFANEEEAKSFAGLSPFESLRSLSNLCDVAIVKVGKEGSWIRRGEEVIKIGTIKARSKDTTGAGDLYASGFLYGYSCGLDLEKCGLIGSVLAGNVIEITGAKMDAKRWEKINKTVSKIIEEN